MDEVLVTTEDGVSLHVSMCGTGLDVVFLSGGPGCVHYLEDEGLVPPGIRAWFPEPRGVGRSGGGAHTMAQAVCDLERVRVEAGVTSWAVVGHSWGSDLAVRYALDAPASVSRVVGIAGHGLHQDRTWARQYEELAATEPGPDIAFDTEVWQSLKASFAEWIHEPGLFRSLAESTVPMRFVAAGEDIRPSWPLAQLAALVPGGALLTVPGVPHDFWSSDPEVWVEVVGDAVRVEPPSPRVLVIGLDPYRVPGPWDPEPVARAIQKSTARFAEHGVGVENCLVGLDGREDPEAVVTAALRSRAWECVVVGGGIRKEEELLALFESVVNLVRRHAPDTALAFNATPADVYEAAARWLR